MSDYGPSSPNPGPPGPHQGGSYGWNPQGGPPGQPHYQQPGAAPYMPVAQPGTIPLRPMGLGDYFNSMFATLRKSPGLFFGAALIFGGIAAILSATGEFFWTRSLSMTLTDPAAPFEQIFGGFGFGIGFLVTVFISQIVMVLGHTFSWGMYATMVARGAVGMKTSLGQGFRLMRGQWGRLLGLLGLIAAAIIVLWIVFGLLGFLVIGLLFAGGEPEGGGAIVAGVLGVLAIFLVPVFIAIYFMIRWYLVVPAIVIEDIGIFTALRRSWRLTRGHFWRTLGITLLFGLILGIVAGVIVSPISFVGAFILASAGTEAQLNTGMLILNMLISAVSSLVGFVVTSMAVLVAVFFYIDYRFRKEGLHFEFQQTAAQYAPASATDRFDTSPEQRHSASDASNDLIPGRYSMGDPSGRPPGYGQPSPYPYGQQPPEPPQAPPQPPGPYQ